MFTWRGTSIPLFLRAFLTDRDEERTSLLVITSHERNNIGLTFMFGVKSSRKGRVILRVEQEVSE
jgi:hypothetical protein